VRRRVARTEIFEPEGVAIRALLQQTNVGRRRRKTSSRQSARPKNLGVLVGALSDADFEAWLARVRTNAGTATEAATRDLVACKGSFGTGDPASDVDVTPADGTWLIVVSTDVVHQLAA
jgi:hypothetical protein